MLRQCVDEALFPLLGAENAFLIAEEKDLAFSTEEASHLLAGKLAAVVVVTGDEAECIIRLERRVDDDRRDAGALGLLDRAHQGVFVERRQDDAVHVLGEDSLDLLHLLLAVVLAQRPFPDDVDGDVLRGVVTGGLDGSGMNALPELVRRSLRDDGDGEGLAFRSLWLDLFVAATGDEDERDCEYEDSFHAGSAFRVCLSVVARISVKAHFVHLWITSRFFGRSAAPVCHHVQNRHQARLEGASRERRMICVSMKSMKGVRSPLRQPAAAAWAAGRKASPSARQRAMAPAIDPGRRSSAITPAARPAS